MNTDNPFNPPKFSVDASAPRKRRVNWMLWVGIATPVLIVAICSGLLMTAEDPVEKSAREAAQGQLLVADAIPAVKLALADPEARVASMMSVHGDLSGPEVKLVADVISEKRPISGDGRATIFFRKSEVTASGYEVYKVSVGGQTREFKSGEIALLRAVPQP